MVDSASSLNDSLAPYVLKKQFMYISFSWIMLLGISKIDYENYEKLTYYMLIITFGVLIFVAIAGSSAKGASRWINFGFFKVQPSEFAKIVIIFYLAHSLSKKDIRLIKQFSFGVLPHLLVILVVLIPIFLQPDFGTSAVIMVLLMAMMIIAGIKWVHIFVLSSAAVGFGYLLMIIAPYRMARINAFLDPKLYRTTTGYQLYQSVIAFSSGKINGVGLGNSLQKRYYLPEAHTDFIASIIGEELGFIGISFLITLYIFLIVIGVRIALKAKTLFGTYIALGITILLSIQILFNLGVVVGAFPTKGLTLPFMSFGGSSMLASMMMMGILLNISRTSLKSDDRPMVDYKVS
jgi:cell division protein FtsW